MLPEFLLPVVAAVVLTEVRPFLVTFTEEVVPVWVVPLWVDVPEVTVPEVVAVVVLVVPPVAVVVLVAEFAPGTVVLPLVEVVVVVRFCEEVVVVRFWVAEVVVLVCVVPDCVVVAADEPEERLTLEELELVVAERLFWFCVDSVFVEEVPVLPLLTCAKLEEEVISAASNTAATE